MSEEKKDEVLGKEKELDESELEAVTGAGSCGCVIAGGGKDKDLNCACLQGGTGKDPETPRLSCVCVVAGGGESGLDLG